MLTTTFDEILAGLRDGSVVPYLGPGILRDVACPSTGRPIPADDHALILAMSNGRPLAAKLMEEFPRAAMHYELKKGRRFLSAFLTGLYDAEWSVGAVHRWLASEQLPYVVDTNRDMLLPSLYADRPHTLVAGTARIMASDYRFRIWSHDGRRYTEVGPDGVDPSLPVLFKPQGLPRPDPTYIASDADYVDYITELMGGFAVPFTLKQRRKDKRYLIAGLRLRRDTQRMILSDIIVDSASHAGWALISDPTPKERRYCATKGITIIEATVADLLEAAGQSPAPVLHAAG